MCVCDQGGSQRKVTSHTELSACCTDTAVTAHVHDCASTVHGCSCKLVKLQYDCIDCVVTKRLKHSRMHIAYGAATNSSMKPNVVRHFCDERTSMTRAQSDVTAASSLTMSQSPTLLLSSKQHLS